MCPVQQRKAFSGCFVENKNQQEHPDPALKQNVSNSDQNSDSSAIIGK